MEDLSDEVFDFDGTVAGFVEDVCKSSDFLELEVEAEGFKTFHEFVFGDDSVAVFVEESDHLSLGELLLDEVSVDLLEDCDDLMSVGELVDIDFSFLFFFVGDSD